MCLPPLGYRADPEEVVAFYAAIAECGLPVMAYNNPEASGVDMPAALIERIYNEVDGVVAIKECSGDTRRIPALLHLDGDLEVLVGGDDWALEGFAAGATGWVTGVGVLAPRETVELYDAVQANDLATAREVYRRMLPVARFDMTPKLVQYFKAAQDAVGFRGGPTRAPRLPLNATSARRSTRRWRSCASPLTRESGALLRGGRLPHGGDADARHHRRRRPDPRGHDAGAQAPLRDRDGRAAAAADAGAARPRRDVGRDPPAPAAARTPTGA